TPSHRKTNRTAGASHGIPTFPAFVFSLLTCQFLRDTSGCVRPEALPLFTHRSKRCVCCLILSRQHIRRLLFIRL
ncbi:hypothetical protein ILYODFUR_011652, partial [Ilyodon furcidens]